MAPRDSVERQFSEDVERLAHGQKTTAQDADYAAMLEFAGRLIALKTPPEAAFTSKLKQDLLLKMAEQDAALPAEARPSLFERLFGGRAVRLAVVSTFIVFGAVGLLWRAGLLPPMMPTVGEAGQALMQEEGTLEEPEAAPEEEPATPDMIRATEATDEAEKGLAMAPLAVPVTVRAEAVSTAVQGNRVTVSLFFENTGREEITIAPFPPRVTIRALETGAVVTTFDAGTSSLLLSSMESNRYDVTWDQLDRTGSQVPPGRYAVDVTESLATVESDKNEAASLDMLEVAVIEIVPA